VCFEASDGCRSRRVGGVVYSLFSHGPWRSVFYLSTALHEVADEEARLGFETETEPLVPTDTSLTKRPVPSYLRTTVGECDGKPTTHQAGCLSSSLECTQLQCTLTHCTWPFLAVPLDTRTCSGKHKATRSGQPMGSQTILTSQTSASSYKVPNGARFQHPKSVLYHPSNQAFQPSRHANPRAWTKNQV